MATSFVTLLFFTMAILGCSMANILTIWREPIFPNDDVTVPDSQCSRSPAQCDRYNAKHLSQCLCYCDKIGGNESVFWEPSYTCIPVRSARSQSGCQLLFSDETADQRLKFFPTDIVREKDVTVPPNQRCTFYYEDQFFVQYLDCTGSWRSLTASNVLDTIELTPGWSRSSLKIRIKAGSTLFGNATAGRLIRVPIQCRHDNATVDPTSSCVVFMVHGVVECPYPKPTLPPAFNPATLPTPVTKILNSTATLLPVTTPAARPTTSPTPPTENRKIKTSSVCNLTFFFVPFIWFL